jgi:hypothetical protein
MQYSKTYAATIAMLLTLLASIFGTEMPSQLDEVSLEQTIQTIVGVISFIVLIVERFRKGGVTAIGKKV